MQAGQGNRMLRRVIALLVLLAGVADEAAGRSFPVRVLVVLLLRRAEAVARAYAADALLVDVICYEEDGADVPLDAAALALRLRALAAALGTLLDPQDVLDAWARTRKAARRRSLARRAGALVAPAFMRPRPHDTS